MIQFFKNFFIYGLASVFGKIAAVFLMPFYTNILTKEEYGAIAMITACKGIIDLISNLNIHSGIARDYYEENINRKKLVSTGFFSILFFSFFILIILFFTRGFWVENVLNISGYEKAFVFMLISIPAGSLLSYFSILTRFKNKPIQYSIGTAIQLLIQIGLSIYFILFLKTGIVGVFIAIVISECFGILYFGLLNKEYISFTFDKKILINALKFSLPTLPAILAGWIDSSMGQLLIGRYVSLDELGVYSVALQLVSVFTLISVALNNVWSPYVYENYKKVNFTKEVSRLYKIVLYGLIFLTFNLSLMSKDIVLLLSNPSYIKASKYFILLCFPMCVYLLLPFVSVAVNLNRETKYLSYSYVSGSVFNLVLLILLLPRFGIMIVPVSLAISRIINYIILYNYAKKKINVLYPNKLLIIFLIVNILCFIIMQFDIHRFYIYGITLLLDIMFIYWTNKKFKWINLFLRKNNYSIKP